MMITVPQVQSNIAAVKEQIAAAAREAGRPPDSVSLIAVSKSHAASSVSAALEAGHRSFGENRVQEAAGKWPDLKAQYPDTELHLIGPLQTNKAAAAVSLFDVIQTLDRESLAKALAGLFGRVAHRPRLYVQVNTGEEVQKAGVRPEDADDFLARCRDEFGLVVSGLMCIPPLGESPAPHFALLSAIAERNGIARLSMGMSADYAMAVRLGATEVRVGTAVFGPRTP